MTGARPKTGQIDAWQSPIRRGEVLQDHGWTDDGEVWIAYRLSKATLESGYSAFHPPRRVFFAVNINGKRVADPVF